MSPAGRHVLVDAEVACLPPAAALVALCEAAIAASGMHVECLVRKDFRPQGMTAVWVLSESHFAVHTYPEHNYLSIDCYTCGEGGNPHAAVEHLLAALSPVVRYSAQAVARGAL